MSLSESKNKKSFVLTALFVVCIAFILYAMKGKIQFPVEKERKFENPVSMNQDEKISVVIDSQQERINFIDNQNVLIKTVYLSDSKIIDNAIDCDLDGEYVYITGSLRNKDTNIIEKSKIVRYTYDGKYVDTVFEIDYPENMNFGESAIIDSLIQNNELYFINQTDYTEIKLYKMNGKKIELLKTINLDFSIYLASYDLQTNSIYFQDYLGGHYVYNLDADSVESRVLQKSGTCSSSVYTKKGLFYINMRNKTVCDSKNNVIASDIVSFRINADESKLFFCNILQNKVCIYDLDTEELKESASVKIPLIIQLKSYLTILAILYSVVFVLFLIFRKIAEMIKLKDYSAAKTAFYSALFVFCSVGISVYYTKNIYKAKFDSIKSHVAYVAEIAAKGLSQELKDNLETLFSDDAEYKINDEKYLSSYSQYVNYLENFIPETNFASEYIFLYKTASDEHFVFYDSGCNYQLGTPAEVTSSLNKNLKGADFLALEKIETENGYYICSRKPVFNNGKEIAVIEFSYDSAQAKKKIYRTCFELAIGLLVIGATLYMLLMELTSLVKTLSKRKQKKESGIVYNESLYSRQYAFITDFINGIDVIVATFTLKEICQHNNFDSGKVAFVISLLPFALYFGSLIGSLLYSSLIHKVNVRKYNSIFAAGMFAFLLVQVLGVKENSIVIFLFGKFLYYIMQMNIFLLTVSVADNAADDQLRYECHKGTTWASVTSGVLASTLGGYLAEFFGNIYVYIAAAGLSLVLLVFGFFILPKDRCYGKNSSKVNTSETSRKDLLKFVFSPRVITYIIFLSVPFAIVHNYKSILFPLFSADYNLPKIYISNLFIIARTLNMIISQKIDGITKTNDYRKQSVTALIFIGIMFFGFILNNTIFWATVMLVMCDLYQKLAGPMHKMIEGIDAQSMNIPRDKSKGIVQTINSLCSCAQTPIFAFFLLFGTAKACVFVGITCIASALIYFVLNIKKINKGK